MKEAASAGKYKQAGYGCDRIAETCGDGGPADPHIKYGDEDIVKRHIEDTARYRTDEGKCGLLRSDHVQSEIIHQQDRYGKGQVAAKIRDAIILNLSGKPHAAEDRFHYGIAEHTHEKADDHIYQNQKCEIFSGFVGLVLAHLLHDHRAAAGCQHCRDGSHQLYDRSGQVDGGQRVRADQIGHEQPVHHGVEGHKNRHCDGRNGEFENILPCNWFVVGILIVHIFPPCISVVYDI